MDIQRQPLDVSKQRRAHIERQFVGGPLERVLLPEAEQAVEEGDADDSGGHTRQERRLVCRSGERRAKRSGANSEQCVEHELQRPGLGEVNHRMAEHPEAGQY
jgi:hypothetical protein